MPEIRCERCGNTILPKDLFCRTCGSSLSSKTVTAERSHKNPLFGLYCPDCGGAISDNDIFCIHCGVNLDEPIAQDKETVESSAEPLRGSGCGKLIVLLLMMAVGYSAIRYFIDRINYNNGHQAYMEADCAAATNHFNSIINGWRIVDIGGYPALAEQEIGDCEPFQAAVNKQLAGDFSAALIAYMEFMNYSPGSVLAGHARIRGSSLFVQVQPSALANLDTCEKINVLLEKNIIPQSAVPPFYLACGKVYDTSDLYDKDVRSLSLYEAILTAYSYSSSVPEAEAALLANGLACNQVESLKLSITSSIRESFMPRLYYRCGQTYEADKKLSGAAGMYQTLLTEYPNSSLAPEAETALLANPEACDIYWDLKESIVANRTEFMPRLYYGCGQTYEADQDWVNAITMYENFLSNYPDHSNASVVEQALARSIVAKAKTAVTFEKTIPEPSGSTGNLTTVIVFQNDSPEILRIVFSGPESHVEELAACGSCITYTGFGRLYCPEKGPIGRYTLQPGPYDVVVESKDSGGITPWRGNWSLVSGSEYSTCFFVVTISQP